MRNKKISLFTLLIMLMSICIPNVPVFAETVSPIKVQAFNANKEASSNTLAPSYKIVNTSTSAINLSEIKLRYYYTSDGAQTDKFWCDHSGMLSGYNYIDVTSKVTGKFGKLSTSAANADSYCEIGFASDAGQLKAGESISVQTRITKEDWSPYTQSNDYSFNSSAYAFADTTTVTGYVGGVRVTGVEPGSGPIIEVKDSTINPTNITFEQGKAKATPITMTLNGNTFTSISNVASSNYTVDNNVVTLSASYLNALPVGTTKLTFNFSAGKTATLNIVVTDPVIIIPDDPTAFTMNVGKVKGNTGDIVTVPVDFSNVPASGILGTSFSVGYDSNLLELVNVTTGAIVKNATVNFSYGNLPAQNIVKIAFCDETYGSELIATSGNFINLQFKIKGTQAVVTPVTVIDDAVANPNGDAIKTVIKNGSVTIGVGPVVLDSTINPTSITFDQGKAVATPITMTLNGNTFTSISNVASSNYTVVNNVLTLSASYLNSLPVGTTTLTFNFSAGKTATLTIVVAGGPVVDFTMNVGKVEGKTGDIVTVPVDFANVPASGILGTSFAVKYDSNLLELVNVTTGAIVKNSTVNFSYGNLPAQNIVKIAFCDETYGSELIATSGNFINLQFKIKGTQAVVTPVKVTDDAVADTNGNPIATTINNGSVTIGAGPIAPDFTMNVGKVQGKIGDIVTVPVDFSNVPANGILGTSFSVGYDSNLLELVNVTTGAIVKNATVNFSYGNLPAQNIVKIAFCDETYGSELIATSGNFINLQFKIKGTQAVVTPVTVIDDAVANPNGDAIKTVIKNGSVTIVSAPIEKDSTINPTSITFDQGKAVAKPITMTLNGNTFTSISNVASSNYTVANNVLTLSANYLNTLPVGTTTLTFNFSAGKTAKLTIVVAGGPVVDFTMNVGKVEGKTGELVTVPVDFANVPASGILGTSFAVKYDSNLLELVTVTPGTIVANSTVNFSYGNLPAQNIVKIAFCDETYGTQLIAASGNFINLQFKIKGTQAVVTPVTVVDEAVADPNGDAIATKINNGSVTIVSAPIEKDSTINPTSITFEEGKAVAKPITMTLNGNTFTSISNVASSNYTVANNVLTLSANYLNTLPVGTTTLTFNFSAGKVATLTVVVTPKVIISDFSMNVGKVEGKTGELVTVPVDFTNVPASGILGTSFSVSYDSNLLELVTVTPGTIVTNSTVNFSYGNLPAQNIVKIAFCDETYGTQLIATSGNFINLQFKIKGTQAVVTPVTVIDDAVADQNGEAITTKINAGSVSIVSAPVILDSTINPTSATFVKGSAVATPVTMTLNGNTFTSISNVASSNYTVANNIVTLSASYLNTLPVGTTTLTFNFSAGKTATLTVVVTAPVPVIVDSTINPTSTTFVQGKAAATPITMTLNGNTFTSISNVASSNYTLTNNVVTLSASYLNTLPVGTTTLTFNFSAGKAATLSVVVTPAPIVPTDFSMDLAKVTGKVGDTVSVTLNLINVKTGILGTSFAIGYNSALLDVVSVTAGSIVGNATTNFAYGNLPAQNIVKISFCDETYGSNLVTKSGTFLTIQFKIKAATASVAPITIVDEAVADIEGNSIATKINNGSITIAQ